jgi:hypothetical protein
VDRTGGGGLGSYHHKEPVQKWTIFALYFVFEFNLYDIKTQQVLYKHTEQYIFCIYVPLWAINVHKPGIYCIFLDLISFCRQEQQDNLALTTTKPTVLMLYKACCTVRITNKTNVWKSWIVKHAQRTILFKLFLFSARCFFSNYNFLEDRSNTGKNVTKKLWKISRNMTVAHCIWTYVTYLLHCFSEFRMVVNLLLEPCHCQKICPVCFGKRSPVLEICLEINICTRERYATYLWSCSIARAKWQLLKRCANIEER